MLCSIVSGPVKGFAVRKHCRSLLIGPHLKGRQLSKCTLPSELKISTQQRSDVDLHMLSDRLSIEYKICKIPSFGSFCT